MKLKVMPSEKINRRYLLIDADKEIVEKAILDYIGILGYAKASPVFVKHDKMTILSINREEINNVRAALEISENKIKVLRVSGTLKGLE